MSRNPFMVQPQHGSPQRPYPNLTRFATNSTEGSNDPYEESANQFHGFPQSPSRAALRYSPERRQRNQFHRGSVPNSPATAQTRLPASARGSPIRGGEPAFRVDDMTSSTYSDRSTDYHFQQRNSIPEGNNLFASGRLMSQSSKYTASTTSTAASSSNDYYEHVDKAKWNQSLYSDGQSIFSTDTFAETNMDVYHPTRHNYVRRANSEIKRREVDPQKMKAILRLDNPIPKGLLDTLPRKDSPEFTEMRYTACTVDPDQFLEEGYSLRFAEMNRECQIVVCVTMYNENKFSIARTIHSIMKNVAHLCSRSRSAVWGPNGWKKVSVILISDGRKKVNQGSLDYLASLGVYQEDMAKASVNGDPVKAHIFELTTQVSINSDLDYVSKDIVPVQLVFCLKEENQKKINSHRWLFNAFCPVLQPSVVALVDIGTKLNSTAIYHLWKTFDLDSNVAGAAGQVKAMTGKYGRKLLNPLVASQNFEYKMSNILDKPLESVFGYISVLPGALSAYRYRALQNNQDGTGPLASYFLGETEEGRDHDIFTANMYLAEDRILCWELVAKKNSKWVLKYVKEATGETDVPEELPEFIAQRRRWLNGAMFAAIYAQLHFYQIWKTRHSITRKIFFHVEFFYQFVQILFSWFSIANFVLIFYYLAGSMNKLIRHGEALFIFFKYLIFCNLAGLFIISMGNRPQGGKHLFILSMVLIAICSTYALICGFVFAARALNSPSEPHSIFVNIIISILSTYGLYAFTSLIYLDFWHIVSSSIQYFLTLPAYTCTTQIFAFCNTHDVSWGTKGSDTLAKPLANAIVVQGPDGKQIVETDWPQEVDKKFIEIKNRLKEVEFEQPKIDEGQMRNDYYRDIRTRIVLLWMLSNLILIMAITQVFKPENANNGYLVFILWSVAALAAFRACGSVAFLCVKYTRLIISYKHKREYNTQGTLAWKMPQFNVFKKDSV